RTRRRATAAREGATSAAPAHLAHWTLRRPLASAAGRASSLAQRRLEVAGKIHLSCAATLGEAIVNLLRQRFVRSNCSLWQHFHTIGAASARGDSPVGNQFLALPKRNLLLRPENLVTHAVRQVHQGRPLQLDNFRFAEVETGIVLCDQAIMLGDGP